MIKYTKIVLLCILLHSSISPLYAEITEEMFNDLVDKVEKLERAIDKVEPLYVKIENIENDMEKYTVSADMEKRMKLVDSALDILSDRFAPFDMSDEVRNAQEFICRNGHVLPISGDGYRCPQCGANQKSRSMLNLFKFAREERISDMIAAAFEDDFRKRLSIGVSATGIAQQILSSDEKEQNFAEGSFDLLFLGKLSPNSSFFIDLEAIGGNGPNEIINNISGLNHDSGSLHDDDGVDRISVRRATLQSFFFDRKVMFAAGKINLGSYFDSNRVANDNTKQFITSAFNRSATTQMPGDRAGIATVLNIGKGISFGMGAQSVDNSGSKIMHDLFAIAEIRLNTNFFFGREGNYRLWGSINGEANDNKGFGISIDQNIFNRIDAFARFGANEEESLETKVAGAWSLGLRLRSPFASRANDEFAFAFGSIDKTSGDNESATEAYYRFQINDHLAITPNFQALFDPQGIGANDTVYVAGVRTQIEF